MGHRQLLEEPQQTLELLPDKEAAVLPAWVARTRRQREGAGACRVPLGPGSPTQSRMNVPVLPADTDPLHNPGGVPLVWGPLGHLPTSVHPPSLRGTLNYIHSAHPLVGNKLHSGSLCCLHSQEPGGSGAWPPGGLRGPGCMLACAGPPWEQAGGQLGSVPGPLRGAPWSGAGRLIVCERW